MTTLVILLLSIILIEIIIIFKMKVKFFDLYNSNKKLFKKIRDIHKSGDKEFVEIKFLLIKIFKIYMLILYPFISLIFLCFLINKLFIINVINDPKVLFNINNVILIFIVGLFYYKARSILSKKI